MWVVVRRFGCPDVVGWLLGRIVCWRRVVFQVLVRCWISIACWHGGVVLLSWFGVCH